MLAVPKDAAAGDGISDGGGIYLGLRLCQTVLQNKAINAPKDLIALVLMRTVSVISLMHVCLCARFFGVDIGFCL